MFLLRNKKKRLRNFERHQLTEEYSRYITALASYKNPLETNLGMTHFVENHFIETHKDD
jgi:hypothetical protein